MNSQDSLIFATQIVEAKNEIIDAIKISKGITLKDVLPMIGVLSVGILSACIAVWSLKRNTIYDREKRADDRKKEILNAIRIIYAELVSLNSQLLTGLNDMNHDKLSFEYYLSLTQRSTTGLEANSKEFDKHMENFKESSKTVKTVLHKYISLLSEYRILTDSLKILAPIAYLNKLVLQVKFAETFDSVPTEKMLDLFDLKAKEAHAVNVKKMEELANQIDHIILTEKEAYK